jgi:hypothetical protein
VTAAIAWSLLFRVSTRAKAERQFARAEELLGRKLVLNSCERYWKDESLWRCEATCELMATSAKEEIGECMLLAHNLAIGWSVIGATLEPDGRLGQFSGTFDVRRDHTPLSSLTWAHFGVIQKQ